MTDLELLNHFTILLYPFVHELKPRSRAERLALLEPRWAPWWSRLDNVSLARTLDDTSFFLPYIRGVLYPETARLDEDPPGEGFENWVAALRGRSALGLAAFGAELPTEAVVRLTCRPEALAPLADFTLEPTRGVSAVTGRFEWLDALLFPSGLGFLLLKVRLREPRPTLRALLHLNRTLRLVHPPSLHWTLPALRFRRGETARVRDLVNHLVAGFVGAPEAVDPWEPPSALSSSGRPYTDSGPGRAYGERCQLLSYACVDLGGDRRAACDAGPFPDPTGRLLFEYAAGLGLDDAVADPMWVPSPEQAARYCREHRMSPWRCWEAMALKEAAVFLATEDLPFNRKSLPHAIENDYLPLYAYTLYQKFQLYVLANDLMRKVAQSDGHVRGVREVLRQFVTFRSRYWFSEVTRKPQGGELYRAFQQGLDVNGLYAMVTGSVKEAKEYHEEQRQRQVKLVLDLLTVVFGPAAAVLTAGQVFLAGAYPPWAKALLLTAIGLGTVAGLAYWWRRRRGGRRRRGTPQPHLLPAPTPATDEYRAAA